MAFSLRTLMRLANTLMARDAIALPPLLMAKVELPPSGVAELVLHRAKQVSLLQRNSYIWLCLQYYFTLPCSLCQYPICGGRRERG